MSDCGVGGAKYTRIVTLSTKRASVKSKNSSNDSLSPRTHLDGSCCALRPTGCTTLRSSDRLARFAACSASASPYTTITRPNELSGAQIFTCSRKYKSIRARKKSKRAKIVLTAPKSSNQPRASSSDSWSKNAFGSPTRMSVFVCSYATAAAEEREDDEGALTICEKDNRSRRSC
jgi:hypothetical protein